MQESPAFFMIVVALAKVEIILLLRDALDPEAVIPSSWQSNGKTHTSEDQPSGSAAEVDELPRSVLDCIMVAANGAWLQCQSRICLKLHVLCDW